MDPIKNIFSVGFNWLLWFRKGSTLNSSHITYHRACAYGLMYGHIYIYVCKYIRTYLKSRLNSNMTELARFARSLIKKGSLAY